MNIYEELMRGQGYAVIPVENMKIFTKLRDSFIERINVSDDSKKNIDYLRKAMANMPTNFLTASIPQSDKALKTTSVSVSEWNRKP